ncbi:hypothetical protein MASR1M8_08730 [Thermomonas brevis]
MRLLDYQHLTLTEPIRKLFLRTLAVLGFIGGAVVLYISVRGPSSFPDREHLSAVTGAVAWTRPDRYGIDFGLEGDARTFSYARKSGELAAVTAALKSPVAQPITALVPNESQRGFASKPFYQVYEVGSKDGPVRTLAQVKHSWGTDYRYGYLAAALAFIAAAYLEYFVRRSQPNNSFKPKPLRGSA